MSKPTCHFCEDRKALIIIRNGDGLCPICYQTLYVKNPELPAVLRKQMNFKTVIDITGTLDYILAQLMCNFIHNGMSISDVSRQMGITRSTVYRKLRTFGLIQNNSEDKLKLNPNTSDFCQAGGLDHL